MLATIGIKNNEANKAPNHSRDLFAKFWAEKKSLQRKERAGQWQTIRQKTSWIFEESVMKSFFFLFAKKGSPFQNQVQLWLGLKNTFSILFGFFLVEASLDSFASSFFL